MLRLINFLGFVQTYSHMVVFFSIFWRISLGFLVIPLNRSTCSTFNADEGVGSIFGAAALARKADKFRFLPDLGATAGE